MGFYLVWTPYLACTCVESGTKDVMIQLDAWAYIIRNKLYNKNREKWYNDMAEAFIRTGLISEDGVIDLYKINEALNNE
jgi:hypothetical protein